MIRYHGGPITPEAAAIRAWKDGHAFISFANQQQLELAFEKAGEVAIDNGAYSLWKAGRGKIDVPAYVAFIEHWRMHPAFGWCVIPDVIDGDEEENDMLVAEWPLDRALSVPVWHMHESLDRLERLANRFPKVAIGSSGEFRVLRTNRWWTRIADAMEVVTVNGYPRVKLHGLRQMDPTIFSVIPYASVDSCGMGVNIGRDKNWTGSYTPTNKETRATVYRDNVAAHASARRWPGHWGKNMELFG